MELVGAHILRRRACSGMKAPGLYMNFRIREAPASAGLFFGHLTGWVSQPRAQFFRPPCAHFSTFALPLPSPTRGCAPLSVRESTCLETNADRTYAQIHPVLLLAASVSRPVQSAFEANRQPSGRSATLLLSKALTTDIRVLGGRPFVERAAPPQMLSQEA